MHDDKLSHVSDGLAAVLARLEAAREALQPLLDGKDGDLAPVRQAVARLERMEAEVARIEGVVAGQGAQAGIASGQGAW
jgi:hypothetical protein